MMDKLKKFMEKIKKQNPDANWANLLTGVAVLVMVAVFSYAYFTKSKVNNVSVDLTKTLEEVEKEGTANKDGDKEDTSADVVDDTMPDIPADAGEKGSSEQTETAVVQKGEGLWQVAQRVCGDGEKYNILANANGLNVWEGLAEGMTLKVVCK